jgi:hypothetical protein
MDVTNRQEFLACLDKYTGRNELEVFARAKRHLLGAADQIGFQDFAGPDYEVMGRLYEALRGQESEASLWGLAFIDPGSFSRAFGGSTTCGAGSPSMEDEP